MGLFQPLGRERPQCRQNDRLMTDKPARPKSRSKAQQLMASLSVSLGVPIFAIGIPLYFSVVSHGHQTQKKEDAVFKALLLPTGYSAGNRTVSHIQGPVGSTPEYHYEVTLPTGKTRSMVLNDFNLVDTTRQQHTVSTGTAFSNTFEVATSKGSAKFLFRPYYDPDNARPDNGVTSLVMTIGQQ